MNAAAENYPFLIWRNWGKDAVAETQAEVMLWTLTPSESVPFLEDFGTRVVDAENAPVSVATEAFVIVEILSSLQNYSSLADPERRVVLTGDMIDVERIAAGETRAAVNYFREADLAREVGI